MKDVEVLKLFPEPIFKYKVDNFEDFNKELSKYIYQLKEDDEKKILLNLIREDGIHQIFKLLKKIQFKINSHLQYKNIL